MGQKGRVFDASLREHTQKCMPDRVKLSQSKYYNFISALWPELSKKPEVKRIEPGVPFNHQFEMSKIRGIFR